MLKYERSGDIPARPTKTTFRSPPKSTHILCASHARLPSGCRRASRRPSSARSWTPRSTPSSRIALTGTIVWANHGSLELLGYTTTSSWPCSPMAGSRLTRLRARPAPHRDDSAHRAPDVRQPVRRKDGALVETEVSTRRVDTALGPVVISVIRDTSEWVESETHPRAPCLPRRPDGSREPRAVRRRFSAIADANRFGDLSASPTSTWTTSSP